MSKAIPPSTVVLSSSQRAWLKNMAAILNVGVDNVASANRPPANPDAVSDGEQLIGGSQLYAGPAKSPPAKQEGAKLKVKSTETPGNKVRSWIQPSESGEGLKLVGMIFFRTKEAELDDNDRRLLKDLADAYARGSRIGKQKTPVSGQIDAYADRRPSNAPGNMELSALRAANVQRQLARAFVESDITSGVDAIIPRGHGVHPEAPKGVDENTAEGNVFAPYRRAEIYLVGKAELSKREDKPDGVVPEDKTPKPPDYSNRPPMGWDKWGIQIARGHRETIHDVAVQILSLSYDDSVTSGPDTDLRDRLTKYFRVKPIKPPWWDGRNRPPNDPFENPFADDPHRKGRWGGSGLSDAEKRQRQLIERAQQMVLDYKLFVNFLEDRSRADLSALYNLEAKPDQMERLGHLVFILDETMKEAKEVADMAK